MDFQQLLDHADYNAHESTYEGNINRYSCVLPPPKKVSKSNVQSEGIKRFLEKKKREEEAKAAEAKRQKEQLLAIRAQSTKNSKKAKIMASRTKDNDFSKIRLTDDEVEAKRRREAELSRKHLAGKVERMKARIEMEEREKMLPKKRKRKSKNGEHLEKVDDIPDVTHNGYKESSSDMKNCDKNTSDKNNNRKPSKPPPPSQPALSFTELLKLAAKKQFEPVDVVIKKKEEEKLMTKKERKIMEEELARQRRKKERLLQAESGISSKSSNSAQTGTLNKKKMCDRSDRKKPVVIHVEKDASKSVQDTSSKFKIPKSTLHVSSNKSIPIKHKDTNLNGRISKSNTLNSSSSEKPVKSPHVSEQKKVKLEKTIPPPLKETDVRKKLAVPKKNGMKINPVQAIPAKQTVPPPKFDEQALGALEKRIREKIEKEYEEKINAKLALFESRMAAKTPEVPKEIKKEPAVVNVKKVPAKSTSTAKKDDAERMNLAKKQILEQRKLKAKLPVKKPFHTNPYLEPPRRLLEPQRPPRPPMKKKIESDDDDDDDDMSDFIDDGPSQNEEDYSKYIQEIFGYDRNRYLDDDDDEVMESSFAEQMKEEVRSARLGYLEDLEEEKLEMERLKKKKKLKK